MHKENEQWHCDCGEPLKFALEKVQVAEVTRTTPIIDVTVKDGRYLFTYAEEETMNVDNKRPKSIGIRCMSCGAEYTTAQVIDIFLGRVDD